MARHRSFTATSLRSLLRHFAPPTNATYARSALFAKANIGFRLFAAGLRPCGAHEIPIPVFAWSSMFAKANIGFRSMPGFHAFIANAISMINAWYKGKVRWYPHANNLLQKCAISNKAINMHSRGRLGASSWVPPQGEKNVLVPPSLKRANGAIILENGLVSPITIPL